jgi:hypothetical protein
MSVHDNPLDHNNVWPLGVVKDKNVVASHTLQYPKVGRRADSTDYHREMRDVFSQRLCGFYESSVKAVKSIMDVALKADETAPCTISEPVGDEIPAAVTESVTSRLLLIVDMATWQVSIVTPISRIQSKLNSLLGDQ